MKTILFLMVFLSLGSFAQSWGGGPGYQVFSCKGYDQDLNEKFNLYRSGKSTLELTNQDTRKITKFLVHDSARNISFPRTIFPELNQLLTSDDYYSYTATHKDPLLFAGGGSAIVHLFLAKHDASLSHMYIIANSWNANSAKHETRIIAEYVFDCAIALH